MRAVLAMQVVTVAVLLVPSAEGAEADAAPAVSEPPSACIPAERCCQICSAGRACGNACIQARKTCHKGRGCACNAGEVCGGEGTP